MIDVTLVISFHFSIQLGLDPYQVRLTQGSCDSFGQQPG